MKKSSMVKGVSKVVGTTLQFNVIATGMVVGGIALLLGKKSTGKAIQKAGFKVGKFAGKAVRASGELAAVLMETGVSEGIKFKGKVGDSVVKSRVRIYGDASEFFDKDKLIETNFEEMKDE